MLYGISQLFNGAGIIPEICFGGADCFVKRAFKFTFHFDLLGLYFFKKKLFIQSRQ